MLTRFGDRPGSLRKQSRIFLSNRFRVNRGLLYIKFCQGKLDSLMLNEVTYLYSVSFFSMDGRVTAIVGTVRVVLRQIWFSLSALKLAL